MRDRDNPRVIREREIIEHPEREPEREQRQTDEPRSYDEPRPYVDEPKTTTRRRIVEKPVTRMERVVYEVPVGMSCGTLTGKSVTNDIGQDLGKIEDIMIDLRSGRILYTVLSFGGFLGMGTKLFAIPWNAMSYSEEKDAIVVNVTRDQLDNAPGFDKDHWPSRPDEGFVSGVYQHYGYDPYWKSRRGGRENPRR